MGKASHTAEEKVLSFIKQHSLVSPGETVVVAVSGGPDSVCLLHILAGLRRKLGISLHVAHLDHRLRGADSAADAAYVQALARRLKSPSTIESIDVATYQKKNRLSLEEAAREVRYRFLASVAHQIGAAIVAVGHTSSDHVETVLMHLIRGSGTRGLRGLLPLVSQKTSAGQITVIRPLLELSREETAAYCRAHRLKPRTDLSNLSVAPFRNRVRHNLLPELQKYNPRIVDALQRTAVIAAADLDFIDAEARRAFKNTAVPGKNFISIRKKAFLALHPALRRQVLRLAVETILGSLKDIESGHIEELIKALGKPAGKVISLPFGLNLSVNYDSYVLAGDASAACPLPPLENEITLTVPGKTIASGWVVKASFTAPSADLKETGFNACFDARAAGNKLTVRRRQPNDFFQPLGMARTKKLNRFMIDARIPKTWRERVPVVCAGDNVMWLAGWRIDERYRVRPETKKVLRLEFTRR